MHDRSLKRLLTAVHHRHLRGAYAWVGGPGECRGSLIARPNASSHAPAMLAVTEQQAAAIRTAFATVPDLP
jgi:hypothetical protein